MRTIKDRLDDVQKEWEEVPFGTYKARLKNIVLKDVKERGLMLQFQFQVIEGDQYNRMIFNTTPLEGPFSWITKNTIERLGIVKPDIAGLADEKSGLRTELIGKLVEVSIEPNEGSNGKTYRKIQIKDEIIMDSPLDTELPDTDAPLPEEPSF